MRPETWGREASDRPVGLQRCTAHSVAGTDLGLVHAGTIHTGRQEWGHFEQRRDGTWLVFSKDDSESHIETRL